MTRSSGPAPEAKLTDFFASRKRKAPDDKSMPTATLVPSAPPSVPKGKEPNSKFKPLAKLPNAQQPTPCIEGKVPAGASILIIQRPWIDLILDGRKSLEVRGKFCKKERERIYLALSGGGGIILGSVEFVRSHGPLSRDEWASLATKHCVAGDALPYGSSTFAWEVAKPIRFSTPVPYHHKPGIVVWAKK